MQRRSNAGLGPTGLACGSSPARYGSPTSQKHAPDGTSEHLAGPSLKRKSSGRPPACSVQLAVLRTKTTPRGVVFVPDVPSDTRVVAQGLRRSEKSLRHREAETSYLPHKVWIFQPCGDLAAGVGVSLSVPRTPPPPPPPSPMKPLHYTVRGLQGAAA